jgi:hypothetical protein
MQTLQASSTPVVSKLSGSEPTRGAPTTYHSIIVAGVFSLNCIGRRLGLARMLVSIGRLCGLSAKR